VGEGEGGRDVLGFDRSLSLGISEALPLNPAAGISSGVSKKVEDSEKAIPGEPLQ